MGTTEEKKKRTSKKNVDGRSTSSHDNKKYRNRSMEKQRGMAFGFRKTATAVIKPDGWMSKGTSSLKSPVVFSVPPFKRKGKRAQKDERVRELQIFAPLGG